MKTKASGGEPRQDPGLARTTWLDPGMLDSGVVTLSNGALALALAVPGAPGTYCGTRFAWAGNVLRLQFHGHHVFGPWRTGTFPLDEHDNVSGTAGEFGMGTAGMPPPLGFADAPAGGEFVKIGVGVLRRPDAAPYAFARRYALVDAPGWKVRATAQRAEMRQCLAHDGYGYDYTQCLEVDARSASFTIRHTLVNTGLRDIHQTHYAHNFFVIDRQPVGPAYEVTFPFPPAIIGESSGGAQVAGCALNFRAPIPDGQAVFAMFAGFGNSPADNGVTIRHREAGVGLRITGDRPVVRYHFFAVTGAVCPEPFVALRAAPGETESWQHRYDFLDLRKELTPCPTPR